MAFTVHLAGFIAQQGMRYMCTTGMGLMGLCGKISRACGMMLGATLPPNG